MNQSIDSSEAGRHLDAARTALGSLRKTATEGPTIGQAEVLARVQTTLDELGLVGHLLRAGDEGPARVACAFCGGMIMPAATLCLYCWRSRLP
jgi:hypothetical protein